MKKSNDISVLMESHKIQFEPIPFAVRSLSESFPKRFNTSKLLISGLYKVIGASQVECSQHFVYAPEQRQAFNDLTRFDPITDLIHMDFLPLKQLLQLLKTWEKPSSLSIYDHTDYKLDTALWEFAGALHGVYPQLQTDLAKRYLDESLNSDLLNKHFPYIDDALVLQERPGKMLIWNPRKACEQSFSQKYKSVINEQGQKKGAKAPLLDVGKSQGLVSMVVWGGNDHSHTIHKELSAITFRLDDNGFDLTAPEKIVEQVYSFAKTVLPVSDTGKVHTYLSCPFQTVTNALMDTFSKMLSPTQISFKVHDVLTGYSPKLSFMSFLSSIEKSSIFIDLGSFPEILCVVGLCEGN
ncbi:MAG: hypothetical protein HRU09_05240 [Oligoflexales bacterium]|nr:hypothetical protein [Oligoflexales bacterium]